MNCSLFNVLFSVSVCTHSFGTQWNIGDIISPPYKPSLQTIILVIIIRDSKNLIHETIKRKEGYTYPYSISFSLILHTSILGLIEWISFS